MALTCHKEAAGLKGLDEAAVVVAKTILQDILPGVGVRYDVVDIRSIIQAVVYDGRKVGLGLGIAGRECS